MHCINCAVDGDGKSHIFNVCEDSDIRSDEVWRVSSRTTIRVGHAVRAIMFFLYYEHHTRYSLS